MIFFFFFSWSSTSRWTLRSVQYYMYPLSFRPSVRMRKKPKTSERGIPLAGTDRSAIGVEVMIETFSSWKMLKSPAANVHRCLKTPSHLTNVSGEGKPHQMLCTFKDLCSFPVLLMNFNHILHRNMMVDPSEKPSSSSSPMEKDGVESSLSKAVSVSLCGETLRLEHLSPDHLFVLINQRVNPCIKGENDSQLSADAEVQAAFPKRKKEKKSSYHAWPTTEPLSSLVQLLPM